MSNGLHIQTLLHHYTTVFSYGFIFLACLTLLVFMVLLPRSIWISKRFTAVCIHHHVRYPAHVVVSCKVNGVVGRGWLNCALVPWTLVSSVHTPDLTCFEQIYVPFLTYATLSLMGREIDACFVCLFVVVQTLEEPPYLTVGTDVSAKYRGAFCEAKIKTAKRLVKAKVSRKRAVISAWRHVVNVWMINE